MAMVVGPVRHNEFGRMRVTREPYFLALPERHPLAGRASVRIEELGEETLLIFTRRLSPDQFDDQIALFKDAGATMRIVEVPAESGGLLGGVAAGHGIGLLPRPSHPYPGTVQVPLGPPLRYVDLNLAWRESQRTPLVQSVLDLVEDLASDGRLGGSSTD